ncbi:F0F1-type ATP synthase, epsilon subunit [Medicago truncatula]|uniref:F0F1-type ATP synthase, epsilon subunit n=2 Tax=Medicago truncatula TaxID=3880 RepID=G7I396_MEDTR|nr:F0F1-type ATP synthase, epsilon subunit [Medicago truncatula]
MGCYTKWDDARTFKCCELLHGLGEHLKQQDGVHNDWDSEVKEIILSTNSGQIEVLKNHAPIATTLDIGILKIRLNNNNRQWVTMALMRGFVRIGNNEITILINDAEKSIDIDPQEAQQTLKIAEANLNKAEGKRQKIEANLALRRVRT